MHQHFHGYLRVTLFPSEVYAFHVLPFGLCTRIATTVAAALRQKGADARVPRRLAFSGSGKGCSGEFEIGDPRFLMKSRIHDQREEVQARSKCLNTQLPAPGPVLRLGSPDSPAHRLFDRQGYQVSLGSGSLHQVDHSANLHEDHWAAQLCGGIRQVWTFVSLQHWLARRWSQKDEDIDVSIRADPDLFHALAPWMNQAWLLAGIPLVSPIPSLTMCADALLTGCGATLGDHHAEGSWSEEQGSMSINALELLVVLRAVEAFRGPLRFQEVLLL
jgi:hypothetical protein